MTSAPPFLGFGLGLRGVHIPHILSEKPAVDWFEIISENYLDAAGQARENLERVLEHYPVVMHGVSLSIGTVDPLNSDYLRKLKRLAGTVKPAWISDHLCWTGVAHQNTHDLLPVPYTAEALRHIVDRIKAVQDALGQVLVLENPSTYLEFKSSEMPEEEFISRMVDASGCGLLLDANNIYVTCFNHRRDPKTYIDALPLHRVFQMHLAGHAHKGTHIIDTHDGPVVDDVWAIYQYIIAKAGKKNTMVEWDDQIPPFPVVYDELAKARVAADHAQNHRSLPDFTSDVPVIISAVRTPLHNEQHRLHQAILSGADPSPSEWIKEKAGLSPEQQVGIYADGYRTRLMRIVSEEFRALRHYLGPAQMNAAVSRYIDATPSVHADAGRYAAGFPAFVTTFYADDVFARALAALEGAVSELAYAEESLPLTADDMGRFNADDVMHMTFAPRVSLKILSLPADAASYYAAFLAGAKEIPVTMRPAAVAVYRHDGQDRCLALERDEADVLSRLFSGVKVADVLAGFQAARGFRDGEILTWISRHFPRWMAEGVFAAPVPAEAKRNVA